MVILMQKSDTQSFCGRLFAPLPDWLAWAEPYWHETGENEGYFGTGTEEILAYSAVIGYMAACVASEMSGALTIPFRGKYPERAIRAYRYILNRHYGNAPEKSGKTLWGRHWGSAIAIERMGLFVDVLWPRLTIPDRDLWLKVLKDEAEYLLTEPIETNRFGQIAETHGERNYWRGTLLFRAARMMPDNPHCEKWQEQSARFCINGVSVPEDESSSVWVDGKPVRERFIGANAHPGCFFEHHGVFSLDYSIIAMSFFVMCLASCLQKGWYPRAAVFHHMADLWRVIRPFLTPDGRVVCMGKQRPRYSIMYNYLLPCLAFWGGIGGDKWARDILPGFLAISERDHKVSADGSFYGERGRSL